MTFMAFSSVRGAPRAVKANQPTQITASTSELPLCSLGKKKERGEGGGSNWRLIKGRECQAGEGSKENAHHHLCWSFIPDSREVSSGTKTTGTETVT